MRLLDRLFPQSKRLRRKSDRASVSSRAVCGSEAYETNGQCGPDAQWRYEHDTLYISGTGSVDKLENANDLCRRTMNDPHNLGPWYSLPGFEELPIRKECRSIVVSEGISSISKNTWLAVWPNLTDVWLPASVTSMDENAFRPEQKLVFHVRSGSYEETRALAYGFRIVYWE